MIIWTIVGTWNPKKLLPFFLRNYLLFSDKIIIYDFMSTDNSLDIVKDDPRIEVRQTGKPYVIDTPTATEFNNTLYQEARGIADWVMMPTIDEFLYCKEGMREALQDYKDRGVTLPDVVGYNMFHDELPKTNGQLWEKYKLGVPHSMFNKPIIFNPELTMNLWHGSHGCSPTGNVVTDHTHDIKLLHYRYWGHKDLVETNELMWEKCSQLNKDAGFGGYNPTNHDFLGVTWWEEEKKKRTEVI